MKNDKPTAARRALDYNVLKVDPVFSRQMIASPFDDVLDYFWTSVFGQGVTPPNALRQAFPRLDVLTDNDNFYVHVAVPGYKMEDVELEVEEISRELILRGKSSYNQNARTSQDKHFLVREIKRSAFERRVKVTEDYNLAEAHAEFKDGILTITVPRVQPLVDAKIVRPITIKPG